MLVVAKEKVYYGGRDRLPGETYEMDDREAQEINILCLIGKIERVMVHDKKVETPPAQPQTYHTTTHEPEPSSENEGDKEATGEEDQPTRKRQYRRRDMRPEK